MDPCIVYVSLNLHAKYANLTEQGQEQEKMISKRESI